MYVRTCTFVIISRSVLLRMKNVLVKIRGTENQNTHFEFHNNFFENRAIYEIKWKNIIECGRPQMAIR